MNQSSPTPESPAPIGAWRQPDGRCRFRIWAPQAASIELLDCQKSTSLPLQRCADGYWTAELSDIPPGFRYRYRIDGKDERPDPASHCQPEGVHGPSAVLDHAFAWQDQDWKGLALQEAIFYELHVGTFSEKGTFEGVIERLDHLLALGITAIEIMPVAHFPGSRNWGYDGVHPFAVHTAYGGAAGLKKLVDACHRRGLAVILDVVYNHLGPEGNYIWQFAPYFTQDKYRTPWGWAVNFDDAYSDGVRAYFIANALYWLDTFHIDGLRLDAVHSICDMSARPFLEELATAVRAFEAASGRKRLVIAESDLNDPRLIRPVNQGGMALDAQWSDDLHHGIHAALTGENAGYYADFGDPRLIATALSRGYSYRGDYSAYRKRRHGAEPSGTTAAQFVVCSQNHDQVGNRMLGERLISLSGPDGARLAASTVLLSPMIPLLFMGEEWGERRPFLYFVDHGDPALSEAVREGRKREFEAFHLGGSPPDPTSLETPNASRLDWSGPTTPAGSAMLAYYRRLIELRKTHPVLSTPSFEGLTAGVVAGEAAVVTLLRQTTDRAVFVVMNFGQQPAAVPLPFSGLWTVLISSSDRQFGGDGPDSSGTTAEAVDTLAPRSFKAYETLIPQERSA